VVYKIVLPRVSIHEQARAVKALLCESEDFPTECVLLFPYISMRDATSIFSSVCRWALVVGEKRFPVLKQEEYAYEKTR
jgi:hypothetical protein